MRWAEAQAEWGAFFFPRPEGRGIGLTIIAANYGWWIEV